MLRLGGFLSRSGHPHQSLDPETIPEARALVERFDVDPGDCCRSSSARMGELLRNPDEQELARCLGLCSRSTRTRVYDVPSSARARRVSRPPSMRRRKASRSWCSTAAAFGGQAGASARIENYLGFPTGISGMP